MSNSSMVVYTQISPNKSIPRSKAIDRITPHCVVGQLSAESICGCFTKTSVKASCNYGIGTDGRVALVVDEGDRSWCSSSAANDNRAVTIECASDKVDPYTMNDKVYASLIELCADICRRNGKSKLLWFGDKTTSLNYEPKSDEMVLTVHRWFANKSCPGDWLYNRMGDLAQKVNTKLGTVTSNVTSEVISNGNSAESTIWDFFKGKGLNDYAIAGLMGNLQAESALRSNNLQNSYETKLGLNDAAYTQAVDDGSYTNFVHDSAGYGLAQWTYWSRKQNLLNYAQRYKKSIGDLGMQLEFLWAELQGYTNLMNILRVASDVTSASNGVLLYYERPANMGGSVQRQRAANGQSIFDRHHSSTVITGFTAYTVRVTASVLNIRQKPTTDSSIVGSIRDKGVYTIVEESSGKGASKWGKLKSGLGWISLDYAKRN